MNIAIISDPHIGVSNPIFFPNWEKVMADVNLRNDIDLVIILGDLTLYGSENDEDLIFGRKALDKLTHPWLVIPGNHDVGDISRASRQPSNFERLTKWEKLYGPTYWFCDILPDWRLIGLNSQIIGTGLHEEVEQWQVLEQALVTKGERKTILFSHMPLFLNDWQDCDRPAWSLLAKDRSKLYNLICQYDISAVVTGHMHRIADVNFGLSQFIWCAASSFLTYDQSMPQQIGAPLLGYTVLHLDDGRIKTNFIELDTLMVSYIEDYKGAIYSSPPKE